VRQDFNDEAAFGLLARVRTLQQQLIKDGVISPQKSASRSAKLAFPLPKNWEAANFGSLCNLITSGSRGWAEYYSKSGPKFIRAQNIRFGRLRVDDLACVNLPKKTERTRTQVSRHDLLVVITGAGVTIRRLLTMNWVKHMSVNMSR
jgi:type I restriction enzyme, S subunit